LQEREDDEEEGRKCVFEDGSGLTMREAKCEEWRIRWCVGGGMG